MSQYKNTALRLERFFDIRCAMITVRILRGSKFLLLSSLALAALSACDITKVSPLNQPYALESYQGPVEVDIGLQSTYPRVLTTNIVQTYTNPTGDKVIIYGLPPASDGYFKILPDKAFDRLQIQEPLNSKVDDLTPTPMVSGLVGRVIDARTVEIEGFASYSRLATDLELEVTGTVVQEGKYLNTLEDSPIVISVRVKNLKENLPTDFLERIIRAKDRKNLAQLDDNEVLELYRITFKGQSLTFAF